MFYTTTHCLAHYTVSKLINTQIKTLKGICFIKVDGENKYLRNYTN